jgi:hypothetical protein
MESQPPNTDMPHSPQSEALNVLFATTDPANDCRVFPRLYKYHKLFQIVATSPSDDDVFIRHETGRDYYLLNPFLVALLRDSAVWFSPAPSLNDDWDAGKAIMLLHGDASQHVASREHCCGLSSPNKSEK